MRYCFFSPGYRSVRVLEGDTRTSGGAEAQVAYLAAAFARLGHKVSLIYGDGTAHNRPREITGVTCIDAAPVWSRVGSLRTFWQAVRYSSPDVIYARLPSDFLWMLALLARFRQKSQFVYAIANDLHCNPWKAYDYNTWFHGPNYALGLYTADVITIQHARQKALLPPHLRDRAALVPNLVRSIAPDVRDYSQTRFDAIWIAKIRPVKQLDLFLRMVAKLPMLQFAVVGDFDPNISPNLRNQLEEQMGQLHNLTVLGPKRYEEVLELISTSKVLVNTSSFEGFPNTMLEAWSLGVPVVSLVIDPGGVIQAEQIGRVSGSESQMLEDIQTVAGRQELNQELGGRGLNYVRHQHSLAAVCDAFERALDGTQGLLAV